jgi:hypothetical protein
VSKYVTASEAGSERGRSRHRGHPDDRPVSAGRTLAEASIRRIGSLLGAGMKNPTHRPMRVTTLEADAAADRPPMPPWHIASVPLPPRGLPSVPLPRQLPGSILASSANLSGSLRTPTVSASAAVPPSRALRIPRSSFSPADFIGSFGSSGPPGSSGSFSSADSFGSFGSFSSADSF